MTVQEGYREKGCQNGETEKIMEKQREESTESLVISGRNAVVEAFRSGKTIDKLFVLDGCKDGPVQTIIREASHHMPPLTPQHRSTSSTSAARNPRNAQRIPV